MIRRVDKGSPARGQREASPAPVTTVTHVVDFTITDSKALYEMTYNHLVRLRGVPGTDARDRLLTHSGMVDVSECIRSLLEVSVNTICYRAGVTLGDVEVLAEVPRKKLK